MIDIDRFFAENEDFLTDFEKQEIISLLAKYETKSLTLQQLWSLMDEVWFRFGCDNKHLDLEKMAKFYRHPVWILNGLFIEGDEHSSSQRQAISEWIKLNRKRIDRVVDYGGGMATLATTIAKSDRSLCVDICEPFPSKIALKRSESYSNIKFVERLQSNCYDCLISTDVLEHVSEPMKLLAEAIESVKVGGYLIFANCFYPVIQCHLPQTFHFRYSFNRFAQMMGLKALGNCPGSHAYIYQKERAKTIDWQQIKQQETLSKLLFPWRQAFDIAVNRNWYPIYPLYWKIKQALGKTS
jgi:2-polyprenyl-3-methyl-5-hydroxy-6-metoxy-1,4-benzoquinol methylase